MIIDDSRLKVGTTTSKTGSFTHAFLSLLVIANAIKVFVGLFCTTVSQPEGFNGVQIVPWQGE